MKQANSHNVCSLKAINNINKTLLKVTCIARAITFFVTTLLFLSPFYLQAQQDSVLKVSTLRELSLEELMDVKVITASGNEQTISEAPSTILVVTAEQITERGYEQLDDVLRDIMGVDLIHTHGQVPSFITFRGMYGDENRRILFMIDGIVENSIMGGIEMGGPAYNLHNAQQIEIIRGPGSALYGANAFSGIINIITQKGEDINGLHYQKGYGSFNTSVDNVMLGIKKSNIDLSLSGSLFNTEGPRFANRHPRYSNSYVHEAWSFNGNVIITHKTLKTTLGVRAYNTPSGAGQLGASPTELLGLPSSGNQNTGSAGVFEADFNGEKPSLTETFARTGFLQSEFTPNSKLTLSVRAQYRETGRSERSYLYVNLPSTDFLRRTPFAYSANRSGGEISARYVLSANQSLSAGVQYLQDNLERGFRGVNPDTTFAIVEGIPVTNIFAIYQPREYVIQHNLGAYLQWVINTQLLKKTNFTVGGRFDNNNIYGSTINPRIGIINQPIDNFTFKILFGTAFRAPTNFELYTAALDSRIANPDLKPERIESYEANLIYNPSKILSLQANLFQNYLRDIIIQDVPIGVGMSQNQNIGTASTRGIEARVDLIPSQSFSTFLNFTYQKGKQNIGTIESDIPNIAKVKGNIGFSVRLAELLNFSLIGNWVGDRSVPSTNPLGKVNGYFIPNLVISTTKLFDNRVSASLNIRNLFNQTYLDPGIRAAGGIYYGTVMEQPGINGFFKISVSLY